MSRYIAFLRAVNVGGRQMKMAQARALFEKLGHGNVETFIASGNIIFESRVKPTAAAIAKIETALMDEFGYDVAVFVRSDAELAAIAARTVFTADEAAEALSLSVGLLSAPLARTATEALAAFNTTTETFRVCERELHFLSRIPTGDSKFSITKLERALGVQTTFRNVTTMARLAAKYAPRT